MFVAITVSMAMLLRIFVPCEVMFMSMCTYYRFSRISSICGFTRAAISLIRFHTSAFATRQCCNDNRNQFFTPRILKIFIYLTHFVFYEKLYYVYFASNVGTDNVVRPDTSCDIDIVAIQYRRNIFNIDINLAYGYITS
jgi:hypothetical protein